MPLVYGFNKVIFAVVSAYVKEFHVADALLLFCKI